MVAKNPTPSWLGRIRAASRGIGISFFLLWMLIVQCDAQSVGKMSCDDPLSLQSTYMNGTWFTRYLKFKFVQSNQGTVAVELQKGDFDLLARADSGGGLLETHTLSDSDVALLKQQVRDESSNSSLLIATGLSNSLISFFALPGGPAATAFWKYLAGQQHAVQVKANALVEVLEEGGSIERFITVGRSTSGGRRLVHTFAYRVDIMHHTREYVTTSCTYSVTLTVSEFKTISPLNNKLVKFVGGRWEVLDVDEGKHDGDLFETSRDDDYIYFSQHDSSSLTNVQRISVNGGGWQFYRDGGWKTLYEKIEAK